MAFYLGEESNLCLAKTSFQVDVENGKVPLEPPFLQPKHPHLPQPLLVRLVFQILQQFWCPFLSPTQLSAIHGLIEESPLDPHIQIQIPKMLKRTGTS